jgi:cell division protein FtsB
MQSKIADLMKELSTKKENVKKMEDMMGTISELKSENERLSKEKEGLKSEISDL